MRKLASIQEVNAVEPIAGADAIDRVRVLGWWVVAKKGEHAPGERVVYCEIDSLLPERPEFEFLRKGCFPPAVVQGGREVQRAGLRVKTVRLRGQVSQGICFPLAILPPGTPTEVGTDVTDALGVIKFDPPPPANLAGRVKGNFPSFIPKTDETRVQVLEGVIARHRGTTLRVTEKLDGSSFTAFVRDGEFGVCSRNLLLDETDEAHLFVQIVVRFEIAAALVRMREKYGFDPAVQGEVIGPGVQGNKYALGEQELRVFNLYDISSSRLVDADRSAELLREAGFKMVPDLGPVELNHSVDELVRLSQGVSVLNPKVQREGVVLRPNAEVFDPDLGGRLSFKAINPAFLLKYDE